MEKAQERLLNSTGERGFVWRWWCKLLQKGDERIQRGGEEEGRG